MELRDITSIFEGFSPKSRLKYTSLVFFCLFSGSAFLLYLKPLESLLTANVGSLILLSFTLAAPLAIITYFSSRYVANSIFRSLGQLVYDIGKEDIPEDKSINESDLNTLEGFRNFITLIAYYTTKRYQKNFEIAARRIFRHIEKVVGDSFQAISFWIIFIFVVDICLIGKLFQVNFYILYLVISIFIVLFAYIIYKMMDKISKSKIFIGFWRKRAFETIESDYFRKVLSNLLNAIEDKYKKESEKEKETEKNQVSQEKVIIVNETNPSTTIKFRCQPNPDENRKDNDLKGRTV